VEKMSLTALARQQLGLAEAASSGRSSATVYGGHEHTLRQTVIALAAGQARDEHENPGEATVQILHGRVRLRAGDISWEGASGDLLTCRTLGTRWRHWNRPRFCSPWPSTASPGDRTALR
jgi:quercetin dioxygenase-like cupin family protein